MWHPILLLILLVAGLVAWSWYKRAPKSQQKSIATRALVAIVVGLLLLGLLTGRLNPLFAALAALVPLAYRAIGLLQLANTFKAFKNQFKSAQGPTPGKASEIETRFLRMRLDHDSGAMDGEILEGAFVGRRLSQLEREDLLELFARCRQDDPQSAAVLEAYLDRTLGDEWRSHAGPGRAAAPSGDMTAEEARQVLGVGPRAEAAEIVAAHRRLMQKLHPDRGGSDYFAAKLNQAKTVLLGG